MRSDEAETYQVTTSNCQYGPPGPPVEELLSGFSMASQGPVCGQWGLFQIMPNGGNPTINQTSGDGLIIIPELSHYYPKDYYSPKNYGLIIIPLPKICPYSPRDTTELTPRPDLHPPLARLPHGAGAVGPSDPTASDGT